MQKPFVTAFREVREVRYQWRDSHRLDNGELVKMLGGEPRTPNVEVVRKALRDLKCL
jgi:hypothetical protein